MRLPLVSRRSFEEMEALARDALDERDRLAVVARSQAEHGERARALAVHLIERLQNERRELLERLAREAEARGELLSQMGGVDLLLAGLGYPGGRGASAAAGRGEALGQAAAKVGRLAREFETLARLRPAERGSAAQRVEACRRLVRAWSSL